MGLSRPRVVALVATGLGGAPAAAHKVEIVRVPIVIGGPVSTAACPGEVVGLDPQGDDVPSVRSGTVYGEVDRIHTGHRVKVCDLSGSRSAASWCRCRRGTGVGPIDLRRLSGEPDWSLAGLADVERLVFADFRAAGPMDDDAMRHDGLDLGRAVTPHEAGHGPRFGVAIAAQVHPFQGAATSPIF